MDFHLKYVKIKCRRANCWNFFQAIPNAKLLHIQISLLNHRLTIGLFVYLDVKSIDQNYCHAPTLIVTSATAATTAAAVAAGDVDIAVAHLCFIIVGRIPMGLFTCRDA